MKRAITPAYVFNVSAKTLDLSAVAGFSIRNLYAVINQTNGAAVFLPATAGYGYSALSAGVLTLQASLTGMSNSDDLLILYEDSSAQAVSAASLPLPTGAALEAGGNLAALSGALGTTADASASSDTGSASLIGLTKRLLAKFASLATTSLGSAFRVVLVDPVTGNGSLVQAFHNSDNQTISGTSYGLMTGGVDQLLNSSGNLDRRRGVSGDAMAITGLAAEVPMLWNGASFDRAYGDKTFGAWVNVKASATLPVSLPSGTTRTAALVTATSTGTVAAGAKSVAFFNAGASAATVAGGALPGGQSVTFSVDGNDTLGAIAYVASATASLLISTVV